jgi:hypothetical protein
MPAFPSCVLFVDCRNAEESLGATQADAWPWGLDAARLKHFYNEYIRFLRSYEFRLVSGRPEPPGLPRPRHAVLPLPAPARSTKLRRGPTQGGR